MTTTPNLGLQFLDQNMAAKEIVMNEGLLALDAFCNTAALSRSITTPPALPADGDLYILPVGASGAWSGHAGACSYYHSSKGWVFVAPNEGLTLWVADEDKLCAYNGSAWVNAGSAESVAKLGVNSSADSTNKLAVKSDAVLFDHDGSSAQVKVNKLAAANNASHLFQTNYSGRAEFGLTGDDNFHIKVSPDGSSWQEALVINRSTGAMTPGQPSATRIGFNILRGLVLPQTQLVIEAMTNAPKRKRSFLIDDLIGALIDAGIWAKLDLLWIMAAADAQAACLNWKNPANALTPISAPSFAANAGYQGNGASSYLDSGIAWNSLSQMSLDSASIFAWVNDGTDSAASVYAVGQASGTTRHSLAPRSAVSGGTIRGNLNGNTSSFAAQATIMGLTHINRSGPTASEAYKNGVAAGTTSDTTTGFASQNVTLLKHTSIYADYRLACAGIGASLTSTEAAALHTALAAYLSGL